MALYDTRRKIARQSAELNPPALTDLLALVTGTLTTPPKKQKKAETENEVV
jgi:hypothetical protein